MIGVNATERLSFRQHLMEDLDAFCAMEMDPDVRRYVGGHPRTREESERRFMRSLDSPDEELKMRATIYKPENKYIGRCGIYPHIDDGGQPVPGEATLGFYISKAYWGRGLATEAGRAFIEYGFNRLSINRIITAVDVRNDASVRVIGKLGFSLDRTEKGQHRSFYHFVLHKAGLNLKHS